jgi:biotin carboxylase
MKSVLILGAADGSLATYRAARRLGYRTVAVDQRDSAPGVALADEHLPVSTRSVPDILAALADRTDVVGVMAPCSDIALPAQRELAARLGVPCGLTGDAVRASVDKSFFRSVCDSLGLPSYRWAVGSSVEALVRAAAGFGGPVVVKPADAQSSRGVTRCPDMSTVDGAVRSAVPYSYGGQVLVEEEVPGQHCGCEAVVVDGKVAFLALTERLLTPAPLAVTTGHVLPARLPAGVAEHVRSIVDSVVAALDYRDGPLNVDLVVDGTGVPYLIEMGARTGGDPLGELVRRCHGVDPTVASIRAAVGEPVRVAAHEPHPVMVQILSADRSGELVAVRGLAQARAMPEVRDLVLLASPGERVRANANLASKLGYAVLASPSVDGLRHAADRLLRTVRFEVAP